MSESGEGDSSVVKELKRGDPPVDFTREQIEGLEKEGYVIINLYGKSIKDLRAEGKPFSPSDGPHLPSDIALEEEPSRRGQVAIKPTEFFLPGNDRKQDKMMKKLAAEAGSKVPGVEVVIGSAADYAELAFNYLDEKGEYLPFEWGYTVTSSILKGDDVPRPPGMPERETPPNFQRRAKVGVLNETTKRMTISTEGGPQRDRIIPLVVPKPPQVPIG